MTDRHLAWSNDAFLSREAFDVSVEAVASRLMTVPALLNVCEDRLHFARGIAAAFRAGVPTLLPPDRGQGHLAAIEARWGRVLRLDDDWMSGYLDPVDCLSRGPIVQGKNDPAIIPFTSGSTGTPVAHPKTLEALRQSAALIAAQVGGVEGVRILATVPPQHMYGLELSILLPLFEGAILDSRRPFYPLDVIEALVRGPGPVALVTTPLHLKALLALPQVTFPDVAFLVSATAPLAPELAREAEQRFKAPLHEVYGCTELGSIAGRRPTVSLDWTWYAGVTMKQTEKGPLVHARHMGAPVHLSDHILALDGDRFELGTRHADLINIAGKRGSIRALEQAALAVDGVLDAAFVLTETREDRVARLGCCLVLGEGTSLGAVKEALRATLDPAFVPRAWLSVDALPRNRVGKLTREALLTLLEEKAATPV